MITTPFDSRSARATGIAPFPNATPDVDLAGPGWYDSSLDLLRGLDVSEGLPINTTLHEWLAVTLS